MSIEEGLGPSLTGFEIIQARSSRKKLSRRRLVLPFSQRARI